MMNLAMGALFGFLVGLAMNQAPVAKPSDDEEYFAAMKKWEARIAEHSAAMAKWSVN